VRRAITNSAVSDIAWVSITNSAAYPHGWDQILTSAASLAASLAASATLDTLAHQTDNAAVRRCANATGPTATGWYPVCTNGGTAWWATSDADDAPNGWSFAEAVPTVMAALAWVRTPGVQWLAGPGPRTPEEIAAFEAHRRQEDTARARAEELLLRHLAPEQRAQLQERGCFVVTARSGRRYRIYRGRSHNVKLLDAADREVKSYCAYPRELVPEGDVMLSQKLMLELAEERFLGIANSYPIQPETGRRITERRPQQAA